jgi:hypothetical protein
MMPERRFLKGEVNGKEKSFGEKLLETVDRLNRRQAENYAMYSAECHRQNKNVGEPIDIMAMLENKKKAKP